MLTAVVLTWQRIVIIDGAMGTVIQQYKLEVQALDNIVECVHNPVPFPCLTYLGIYAIASNRKRTFAPQKLSTTTQPGRMELRNRMYSLHTPQSSKGTTIFSR